MPIPWDVAWERLPRLPRSALSLEPAVSPYHFHDLGPFSVARPGVAMGPARPPAPPPSWSSLLSSPGFSMEAVLTKCNLLQNSLVSGAGLTGGAETANGSGKVGDASWEVGDGKREMGRGR